MRWRVEWRVAWWTRRRDNARTITMTERAMRDSVQRAADTRVSFRDVCSVSRIARPRGLLSYGNPLPPPPPRITVVTFITRDRVTFVRKSRRASSLRFKPTIVVDVNRAYSSVHRGIAIHCRSVNKKKKERKKFGACTTFASTTFVNSIILSEASNVDKVRLRHYEKGA